MMYGLDLRKENEIKLPKHAVNKNDKLFPPKLPQCQCLIRPNFNVASEGPKIPSFQCDAYFVVLPSKKTSLTWAAMILAV